MIFGLIEEDSTKSVCLQKWVENMDKWLVVTIYILPYHCSVNDH